jgi:hypothetical protein
MDTTKGAVEIITILNLTAMAKDAMPNRGGADKARG